MRKNLRRTLACLLAVVMCVCAVPMGRFTVSAADYKAGDIIEFGSYPQSQVTDEKLLSELNKLSLTWKSYGYYSGNGTYGSMVPGNWMRYADVVYSGNKYRAVIYDKDRAEPTTKSSGYCIQNNGYWKNNIYFFKYEPIKWKVLDPKTGLIFCETIIDSQAYNNTIYGNAPYYMDAENKYFVDDYKTSSVREWLNNTFYNTAFNYRQKNSIMSTVIDNDIEMTDKIFCLSSSEVSNTKYGFSSSYSTYDPLRRRTGSDYAKSQGLFVATAPSIIYKGCSHYWLRQKGSGSRNVNQVFDGGQIATISMYHANFCNQGVRPAMTLDLSKIGDENKQFPAGYDVKKDTWNFSNPSTSPTKSQMLSWMPSLLEDSLEDATNNIGLCFGMTSTSIALHSQWQNPNDFDKDSVSEIKKSDTSTSLGLSAIDYIRYMFCTQFMPTVSEEADNNTDDLKELYKAVKNYEETGENGVNIGIFGRYWGNSGHSVWGIKAIDYDDRSEILVYDSNYPNEERYITLTKSDSGDFVKWSYTLFDGYFDSNVGKVIWGTGKKNAKIHFSTQSEIAYFALLDILDRDKIQIGNPLKFSSKYNLVTANNADIISDSRLIPINVMGTMIDPEKNELSENPEDDKFVVDKSCYWTEGSTIKMTCKDLSATCNFVGTKSGVKIKNLNKGDAVITLNDGYNCVTLNNINFDNFTLSFVNDNEDTINDLTISGTASSDSVTATQTETGIVVTGLSDGTVTLSKDDEVISKQEITGAVSDIEITYDKDGSTDDMDVDYDVAQHEHTDKDNDGKCDICGEKVEADKPSDPVGNCTCLCHKTGFLGFIYKIVRIFWKIFKINQTCACGQKHY